MGPQRFRKQQASELHPEEGRDFSVGSEAAQGGVGVCEQSSPQGK